MKVKKLVNGFRDEFQGKGIKWRWWESEKEKVKSVDAWKVG